MVPNPVLSFNLFGKEFSVYLYGVCIAVGLLACIFVFYYYTNKKKVPTKMQDFVFFIAIISIAIGFLFAKLYQAFYDYLGTGVFDFYGAGMTVMGGLIGGAGAFLLVYFLGGKLIFKNKEKDLHIKYFNDVLLVAPICITIAHAFGRLGCLMSGCCHGAYLGKKYVFGGIWMRAPDTGMTGYHVPTQLYEALFLFALFAVLTVLYFKRCNILLHIYLIAYGVWRFIIEFIRTDAVGVVGGDLFRPSQWQSFVFVSIGIALIIFYVIKKIPIWLKTDKEEIEKQETKE